jgi:hypothetical protein
MFSPELLKNGRGRAFLVLFETNSVFSFPVTLWFVTLEEYESRRGCTDYALIGMDQSCKAFRVQFLSFLCIINSGTKCGDLFGIIGIIFQLFKLHGMSQ